MLSGPAPAKPEMKRKTKNWLMFVLRAQPMTKATKITLQVWYTTNRPYISEKDEIIRGPKAKPRR
jgi:hypothetical protein